jgi:hypothetical protein
MLRTREPCTKRNDNGRSRNRRVDSGDLNRSCIDTGKHFSPDFTPATLRFITKLTSPHEEHFGFPPQRLSSMYFCAGSSVGKRRFNS